MRWVIFLVVFFLFLGAFLIISNENLHLRKQKELAVFYNLYYSWLSNLANQGEHLSGYAIKLDWLPTNSTLLNASAK